MLHWNNREEMKKKEATCSKKKKKKSRKVPHSLSQGFMRLLPAVTLCCKSIALWYLNCFKLNARKNGNGNEFSSLANPMQPLDLHLGPFFLSERWFKRWNGSHKRQIWIGWCGISVHRLWTVSISLWKCESHVSEQFWLFRTVLFLDTTNNLFVIILLALSFVFYPSAH